MIEWPPTDRSPLAVGGVRGLEQANRRVKHVQLLFGAKSVPPHILLAPKMICDDTPMRTERGERAKRIRSNSTRTNSLVHLHSVAAATTSDDPDAQKNYASIAFWRQKYAAMSVGERNRTKENAKFLPAHHHSRVLFIIQFTLAAHKSPGRTVRER